MIFVVSNHAISSVLRGEHVASATGAKLLFADIGGARNADVVFVKEADRGLVLDAKDRGNRIVYDVIDFYCYKNRSVSFSDLVDVLIVPNRACIGWYAERFPNARFCVIPHQWDHRIKGLAQHERYAPGYIGKGFNFTVPDWDGAKVFRSEEQLEAVPQFNLHLALQRRDEKIALLKPATKVSTAAAVLANVLTYRDPSAVELLGDDYPFYVDGEPMAAIRIARDAFGGKEWRRGREMMQVVKEKTSLAAVAKLYLRLRNHDKSMLLDAPIAEAALA